MGRGNLRIYLGAAPGVGKTYAMLNEGVRRHERGTDIVIGYVETHGRRHTVEQIGDLEIIERRKITYRGQSFEEMDLDAVIARSPDVALVDEFAHTNTPGVEHEKRWQDVEAILNAGINVITTLNLQHLESVNDVVETITGIVQRETVPDAIVRRADQIELVDMTPEALRRRLAHGNVYPADRVDAALSHFFRPGNLAALRELALLWLADRVDDELAEYRVRHGIAWAWETKERVAVLVTGSESSERLIRRASRIAVRSKAELVGVAVRVEDGVRKHDPDGIERCVELLTELGGRYIEVVGNDVAKALVAIARTENATQLVIGSSRRSRWSELTSGSIVQRCVREAAGEIDVHVIGTDVHENELRVRTRRRYRAAPLSLRRIVGSVVLGIVAFPVVTELLLIGRTDSTLALALSTYLLVVIGVAALGGLVPGLVSAAAAFLLSNFEFAPPIHKFTIADPRDIAALAGFFVAAITVSSLVDLAARRSADAVRAQRDARALARMASLVTAGDDAVEKMMADIVRIFDLDGASLRTIGGGEGTEISVGEIGDDAKEVVLDRDHFLVISGRQLDPESAKLLQVVTSQLVAALDRRRLEMESAERVSLKNADDLRSTLLASVSHDLRMPLASIKTAATSLMSESQICSKDQQEQLLRSIDAESERLSRLVEDLLDMSRINEGSIALAVATVDLVALVNQAIDDAVAVAGVKRSSVTRTGVSSASFTTDPVLVTRVVYNLVVNSIVHAGGEGVTVDVGGVSGEMTIRVIDHGRGMSSSAVATQLRPVLREGDLAATRGVGLGLAISRGFIIALGGELNVEDTPGGGCTMALVLPVTTATGRENAALGA